MATTETKTTYIGSPVERVEDGDIATHVWLSYPAPVLMGGNFWVAVEFPGAPRLTPAQDVTFTGRIEKIEYLNHEAAVTENASGIEVKLIRALANKDFVLRYKVAGGAIKKANTKTRLYTAA